MMVVAIEYCRPGSEPSVTELNCSVFDKDRVAKAIHLLTGECPQPVPISAREVTYRCYGLTLDRACALLRLVTEKQIDPRHLTMERIDREVELQAVNYINHFKL